MDYLRIYPSLFFSNNLLPSVLDRLDAFKKKEIQSHWKLDQLKGYCNLFINFTKKEIP